MRTKSFLIISALIISYGLASCMGIQSKEEVFKAYELRINGHADSAKLVLKKLLGEDSTNALAWYELCRTTMHLGLSNPRETKESINNALKCINKAVKCDPQNTLYLSYKGSMETLAFYIALQMGNENAGQYLEHVEKTFNTVFEMDPSYTENKLTLVEFFGGLPKEMGGDKEKAEKYAKELEDTDLVAGAKAREILMPEDADYVAYWKEIVGSNPENADALQALGRVFLFEEDLDNASDYYLQAINLDPSKNMLYLDLGRYYLMMAMQNPTILDSVKPLIEEQFNKYLTFEPEPINPMKAWTYNQLAMINRRSGNEEASAKYKEMANKLDPFCSYASGKPGTTLYCPPDVIIHEQGYYLSPF